MRIALALILVALPAAALDLMELKSGKLVPVEEAKRVGDRLHVRVATARDEYVMATYPIDQVLPEFVFHVWASGLEDHDRPAHAELAEWACKNGLHPLALKIYERAAEFDEGIRNELPAITRRLHEEHATWLYEHAEALFREGEVADARVEVDRILAGFEDTAEHGRAQELKKMIDEREQFLSAERKRKEAASRLRKQAIEVRTQAARIAQGKAYASGANLRYVAVARWRLNWACCLYEGAADRLETLLPYVDDGKLRERIGRHLEQAAALAKAAYVRLADLRYLGGDLGAALDAAHRVLDLDPENRAAAELRDRILDGPGPTHIRRDRGFLTYRRQFAGTVGFGIRRDLR